MGLERLLGGAPRCYPGLHRLLKARPHVFGVPGGPRAAEAGGARPGARPGARGSSGTAQPPSDVTLFRHDRTPFFRLLASFCGGQLLFWTYLAHFAFTGLRDGGGGRGGAAAPPRGGGSAGTWPLDVNLGTNTWRYGFTAGCLAIGGSILGLGVLFCRRSVSQVVLHRGGAAVTVCTQSPWGAGRGRRVTVPLSQVACHAHRQESPSFIPLRVKGHRFYFLLDKEGTITNAKLFDVTVGAYRPL